MTRVFISYVRENVEAVTRLAETLGIYDLDVWLDSDRLKPGLRWADEIRRGIAQGDFFIACFSDEYNERSKSYMNEEVALAIEELRQRPTDRAWFIPVLLSDTEVPDRTIGAGETLRSIQWVPLHEDWDDGVSRILSVIQPDSGKVHQLINALDSPSARARIRAADSLGVLGGLASQAVPRLTALLADDNETVRAAVAEALGNIGVARGAVIAELLSTMRTAEVYYDSRNAGIALSKLGRPGIAALLEATTFDGYAVGDDALDRVASLGAEALPLLLENVAAARETSAAAAEAIRRITDLSALSGLTDALREGRRSVQLVAIEGIGRILQVNAEAQSPDVDAAIEMLIEALDDKELTLAAVRALGSAGERAEAVVPMFNGVLNGDRVDGISAADTQELRREAVYALGRIGDAAREAVPALVRALAERDQRAGAARALGGIGPAARGAAVDLAAALKDPDDDVRFNAAEALGLIGDRAAIAALSDVRGDGHQKVRLAAERAIARLESD